MICTKAFEGVALGMMQVRTFEAATGDHIQRKGGTEATFRDWLHQHL